MTIWNPRIGSSKPRYQAIVNALSSDIEVGRLQPGARLPTHRQLAKDLGVSIGTITRALNIAERRGLVRGETGRGTFVGGADVTRFGAVPSPGEGLVDLSRTWPLNAFDPDIGPALRDISRSTRRAELLQYQPNAGMARHRAAGVTWARRFGVEATSDCVVVCAGAQHAMQVALATLVGPGDCVLTEELTYPGVKAVAQFQHLKILGLPMDELGILPEAFDAACAQRNAKVLYCTPTLQNPTTATMDAERRHQIVEIARNHDVAIIEDDLYHLLGVDPPPPIATLAPERTYFIPGISKCVCGGLRVAFLIAPRSAIDALTERVWATTWMVSPLTAEVAARWIEDGTADRTVETKRREAGKRQRIAADVLNGVSYRSAPHAYHLWLPLPQRWTGAAFTHEARQRGVSVMPSETFAVRDGANHRAVRLCLSSPWDSKTLRVALERVAVVLAGAPRLGPAVV